MVYIFSSLFACIIILFVYTFIFWFNLFVSLYLDFIHLYLLLMTYISSYIFDNLNLLLYISNVMGFNKYVYVICYEFTTKKHIL